MKEKYRFMLLIFVCLGFISVAYGGSPETGQHKAKLETQVQVTMNYLLFLPQAYGDQHAWPLVLFLHGGGERGDNLELVKKHGLPKLLETRQDFPAIVISPQCKADGWWEPTELLALLDYMEANYKVDKDRVYVTGMSMGGFGTWALASRAPSRFAAIVPICGGGEPYWARRLTELAVWVFHGAQDTVVPLRRSEDMVNALRKAGGQPKFTVYPDLQHDSWTETYNNPELYEWLLKQKRAP